MSEYRFWQLLIVVWLVLAAVTFVSLFLVAAPYGRHSRRGWGAMISSRWGWMLMETPAALVILICFVVGEHNDTITAWVFLVLWEIHYLYRVFIYPFTLRDTGKGMSLTVVAMAIVFNIGNGYINGRYLFTFSGGYANSWLLQTQFLIGLGIFIAGLVLNRRSDAILNRLRNSQESGYKIPRAGFFKWVSCPNYLGECIEWVGWAVLTWSIAGLTFAIWTAANLVPRARSNHRWYKASFPDYPPERKALIPFIW
ncbi:MAG: DUF1295 domain-containing protein [Chloroflexi bacterium]|nr:DUF1295 domain-containing protein [Chloroflexota bacterium]